MQLAIRPIALIVLLLLPRILPLMLSLMLAGPWILSWILPRVFLLSMLALLSLARVLVLLFTSLLFCIL